ncbi:MAG: TolC family protein [Calditrichota bacterium]
MFFKRMLPLISIVTLFMPISVFTQTKMVLTLESSIDYALEQNPQYQIAQKQLAKAKASVTESYANILPQLDASANFQHNWKIQENTIPNFIKFMLGPGFPGVEEMPDYVKISFGLENTLTYGAMVTQPLFLGGAGIAGIQTARAAARASEQNLEAQKQNLIYQSANAFYSCLVTKEVIAVQEEALAQAQENLKVVSKKYDVGMASGFDKMRAQVDVANLQPSVITSKNNYQYALTYLRTILGLPKETDIEVSGELVYTEDDLHGYTLPELQEMALKNRPEMLGLEEQKTISRKGIVIARSQFLPKLFFSTDYSFLAMRNDLKFSQDDFSEGFTSGLSLQIPLFHGFRSAKQYQKAKLDYKITLDAEKQTSDLIIGEVEVTYNKFNESREKYLSAKESVQLAEEALRLANLMYEEGTNTQLDVISSQLALNQSRMNYVNSLFEYQVSRYQLRKSVGKLDGVL